MIAGMATIGASTPSAARPFRFGRCRKTASLHEPTMNRALPGSVAHRLDVVAVRIEDVCTVVVGVIESAYPRRPVVGPARVERGGMERIDGWAIVDRERDVEPPYDRLPSRLDPEEGLAVAAGNRRPLRLAPAAR